MKEQLKEPKQLKKKERMVLIWKKKHLEINKSRLQRILKEVFLLHFLQQTVNKLDYS